MLDRIDIHVEDPRVGYEKLSSDRLGEPSASVREQVRVVRGRQRVCFEGSDDIQSVHLAGAFQYWLKLMLG